MNRRDQKVRDKAIVDAITQGVPIEEVGERYRLLPNRVGIICQRAGVLPPYPTRGRIRRAERKAEREAVRGDGKVGRVLASNSFGVIADLMRGLRGGDIVRARGVTRQRVSQIKKACIEVGILSDFTGEGLS